MPSGEVVRGVMYSAACTTLPHVVPVCLTLQVANDTAVPATAGLLVDYYVLTSSTAASSVAADLK